MGWVLVDQPDSYRHGSSYFMSLSPYTVPVLAQLYQGPPAKPSTGRKVVDGIANAAEQVKAFGRDACVRFGRN
jgi:hypothetical protein